MVCSQCVSGVQMVGRWCADGVQVMCSRCAAGVQVVCRCYAAGVQPVCSWCAGDMQVTCRWCAGGVQLMCMWCAGSPLPFSVSYPLSGDSCPPGLGWALLSLLDTSFSSVPWNRSKKASGLWSSWCKCLAAHARSEMMRRDTLEGERTDSD